MPTLSFQFSHVEQSLAAMHRIVDSKRSAFQGRLKHYQKQGFPAGINTGRGRAAVYHIQHALQLAIALEMNQVGLVPERAIDICIGHADRVRGAISIATSKILSDDKETTLLVFDPFSLSDLSGDLGWDVTKTSFDVTSASEFRSSLDSAASLPSRRYALIDVTSVVLVLAGRLGEVASCGQEELLHEMRISTKVPGGWSDGNS